VCNQELKHCWMRLYNLQQIRGGSIKQVEICVKEDKIKLVHLLRQSWTIFGHLDCPPIPRFMEVVVADFTITRISGHAICGTHKSVHAVMKINPRYGLPSDFGFAPLWAVALHHGISTAS